MNTNNLLGPHAPETQKVLNEALASSELAPSESAGQPRSLDVAACSVSGKRAASELKHLLFPACSRYCSTMEYLGCGECEAVCPQKFDRDGTPKTQNDQDQTRRENT